MHISVTSRYMVYKHATLTLRPPHFKMADRFTGKSVRLTLADKNQLYGTVESVNAGIIHLSNVQYLTSSKHLSKLSIQGSDIVDLEVLESSHAQLKSESPPKVQSPKSPSPAASNSSKTFNGSDSKKPKQHKQQPFQDPAILHASKKKPMRNSENTWTNENVAQIKQNDFDFEKNLSRFDKALVFDEIRQADTTNPNSRLVAHNKVGPSKYGNTEMVIDASHANWAKDIVGRGSPSSSVPAAAAASTGPVKFTMLNTGQECPAATPIQLVQMERVASEMYELSPMILHENSGRSVSQIVLRLLGGPSRFNAKNHNSRPFVVVIAGDCPCGYKAIVAARHLANRHVDVLTVVVAASAAHKDVDLGSDPGSGRPAQSGSRDGGSGPGSGGGGGGGGVGSANGTETSPELKAYTASGGRLVLASHKNPRQLVAELEYQIQSSHSPPELLIDALQGIERTVDDVYEDDRGDHMTRSLISWINSQKTSVLSIDVPTGLDASTGAFQPEYGVVEPKCVVSCGFPCTGLSNAYNQKIASPGDWTHFVVDCGFPAAVLRKVGKKRFDKVWYGDDWVVELSV